jgi:hypothetical protein
MVEIEVQNETTGEPMVVPFDFVKGGLSFKYKNILIFPVKVEDNRVPFVIDEAATPSQEQSPIPLPKGGEYLCFHGGEKTKVFLIDSNMSYGTYDKYVLGGWHNLNYSAEKEDPCVIINGTIRNEYDKDYFICLMADIYPTFRIS